MFSDAAVLILSVTAIGFGGGYIGRWWIRRDARKAEESRHVHLLMVANLSARESKVLHFTGARRVKRQAYRVH